MFLTWSSWKSNKDIFFEQKNWKSWKTSEKLEDFTGNEKPRYLFITWQVSSWAITYSQRYFPDEIADYIFD